MAESSLVIILLLATASFRAFGEVEWHAQDPQVSCTQVSCHCYGKWHDLSLDGEHPQFWPTHNCLTL